MIQINGHWENVDSLQDISKIIREYYNRELADRIDALIDDIEYYRKEYYELEDVIEGIRMLVGQNL